MLLNLIKQTAVQMSEIMMQRYYNNADPVPEIPFDIYKYLPLGIYAYDGDVTIQCSIGSNLTTYNIITTLYYSFNVGNWTEWDVQTESLTIPNGKTMYFYGPETNQFSMGDQDESIFKFKLTSENGGKVNLVGQFLSILDPDYITPTTITRQYISGWPWTYAFAAFCNMFRGNDLIYDAYNMHINFKKQVNSANYSIMLGGFLCDCVNLKRGFQWDYQSEFEGIAPCIGIYTNCTSLVEATVPWCKATVSRLFENFFKNCSSLQRIYYKGDAPISGFTNFSYGVPSTGTFYNLGNVSYSTGTSGIPSGWTVVNS